MEDNKNPSVQVRKSKYGKLYSYPYTGRHYIRKYPNGKFQSDAPFSKLNLKHCLERDNFTCQMCGKTKARLHIHHKDNKGRHVAGKNTNNALSNLITLCPSCHMLLHCGVYENHLDMIARRVAGESLQSIANSYGVSRQRIHQILQ